jgi:hypothetical protein
VGAYCGLLRRCSSSGGLLRLDEKKGLDMTYDARCAGYSAFS